MNSIGIVAKLGLLCLFLFLGFGTWLYKKEVNKVKSRTGIVIPGKLVTILSVNMWLSWALALLLFFWLLFDLTS